MFSSRSLAILLMLLGLICYIVTLIFFEDQVLCMLGSTLVTFAGLGVIVLSRKTRPSSPPQAAPRADRSTFHSPPGLGSSRPAPIPQPQIPQVSQVADTHAAIPTLLDHVMDALHEQGAQIHIEVENEDRGILRVTSPAGRVMIFLVREDAAPVDVADVRSLFALISSSSAEEGTLIAAGPFTERAQEWAQARGIRLVAADELHQVIL